MSENLRCGKCFESIDEEPFRHDPNAEYHEVLSFLLSLEHTCKTTLDIGIRVKDYLEKNKSKFERYKTPF